MAVDLDRELAKLELDIRAIQKALKSPHLVGTERPMYLKTLQELQAKRLLLLPIVEVTPSPAQLGQEPDPPPSYMVKPEAKPHKEAIYNEIAVPENLDLRRWAFDFIYAAKTFPIVYRPGMRDVKEKAGPMVLTQIQEMLVAVLIEAIILQKPLRLQVLKSRQLGCTTLLLAFASWMCQCHENFRVFFIIDKDNHLYTKRQNLIAWVAELNKISNGFARLKRGGKGQKVLEFSNGSMIFLESAQAPNPGTSDMYHMVITSEEPKWVTGRPEQVKASIYPGVPNEPLTFIIRESTAEGLGLFYRDFVKSKRGKSGFTAFFAAWFFSHEYSSSPTEAPRHKDLVPHDYQSEYGDVSFEDDTRELTELEYQSKYGLNLDQLRWRRQKIDELGSRALFDQEYPTTWRHAFRSTSLGFYPPSLLDAAEQNLRRPIFIGDLAAGNLREIGTTAIHFSLLKPILMKDPAGPLQVIEFPVEGRRYFGGVDCAEGLTATTDEGEDQDYTVITIKDENGYSVAKWRGRIKPEEAWLPYCMLGIWYNMATLNGELQNAGALLLQMRTSAYPHLLVLPEPRHRPAVERLWTRTSKGNRDLLLAMHRKALREDPRRVGFQSLLDELTVFVRNKTGKYGAAVGFHDDDVMSDIMAEYCREIELGIWLQVSDQPEVEPATKFKEPPSGEVALWQTDVGQYLDFGDTFLTP